MRFAILALPLLLTSITPGTAQGGSERYRLERTEEGYVRMDTQTGAMSLCTESQGGLVCRLAADERAAVQDEIERLETDLDAVQERLARIEALEQRVATLESALAAGAKGNPPTDEEMDKTIGFMERFFRSFLGIVKEFESDVTKPQAPSAPPSVPPSDKT